MMVLRTGAEVLPTHFQILGLFTFLTAWCRNQGLAIAKGEYIGFVDADDVAKKDKLAKMTNYLDKYKDILVVSGGCAFIDKSGKIMPYKVNVICKDLDIRAYMLFGNCIAGPCALFRRTIVDRYHVQHDVKMRTSQDYFFWIECLRYGRFYNLQEPLFYYRTGHNSQCNQNQMHNPKQYDYILQKIFRYAWKIRGFCLSKNEIEYIYRYFYKNEGIRTVVDWLKGIHLYYKIKNQIKILKLDEGEKILELYKTYLRNQIVADIKFRIDVRYNDKT